MEIAYSNFGNNHGHYSHVCNHPFKQDSKDAASGVAAFQHAIGNIVCIELWLDCARSGSNIPLVSLC